MDYKKLLNKDFFILWINEIARKDENPTIRSAAKEISQMVRDNYAVQSKSYYEPLYLKYKFKLYPTNTSFGSNYLRNILYSYDGMTSTVVGLIQPIKNLQAVPQTIISTPTPSQIDLATYSKNEMLRYLTNFSNNPKPIYSVQDHETATYVRNVDCWAYPLRQQMTCISPWNSDLGNLKAGTLITPRHVVFADHYYIEEGSTIRFVTADNQVIDRTIVRNIRPDSFYLADDFCIGILDEDVPNSITPCWVLPHDYAKYLYKDYVKNNDLATNPTEFNVEPNIPCLYIDQEEKALLAGLYNFGANGMSVRLMEYKNFEFLWEGVVLGDSGNPIIMLLDNKFVLLATWYSGFFQYNLSQISNEGVLTSTRYNFGPAWELGEDGWFRLNYNPSIDERIKYLDGLAGVNTNYETRKIDLTKFTITDKSAELNGGPLEDYYFPRPTPTPSRTNVNEPRSLVAEIANQELLDIVNPNLDKTTFVVPTSWRENREIKNPKHIFKKQGVDGVYERNEECFIYPISQQSSCVSVWNSDGKERKKCTLITPRHVIMSKTNLPYVDGLISNGSIIRFVSGNNQIVEKTLVDTKTISDGTNVVIGLLDSDVDTNLISPCYFLPNDYNDYFNSYNPVWTGDPYSPQAEFWINPRIGCFYFDFNNTVSVLNLRSFWYNIAMIQPAGSFLKFPWLDIDLFESYVIDGEIEKNTYSNRIIKYPDSAGCHVFMILQNKLILITQMDPSSGGYDAYYEYRWIGTNYTDKIGDINNLINEIDIDNGINTGYIVNQIDLSGYQESIQVTPTPTPSITVTPTPSSP